MDSVTLGDRSRYHDLTLFGICVVVDDDVTKLYGVMESESDNDEITYEQELENYLIGINSDVSPQSMARMKQTARKTNEKGVIPVTTAGNIPTQNPSLTSPGGLPIAVIEPRRSRRFLESDSEIEQAANLYSIDMDFGSPARSTRSKSPGSARSSPARGKPRGSPARSTPDRGRSPARSSPARSTPGRSPARGSPTRGSRGRGGSARGRGRGVVPTSDPKPGTSGTGNLKPGQAGFVSRGGGGGSGRGASRSSPGRWNLPSFSTEEEDDNEDDDDDTENEEEDDDEDNEEEDMEVDFPNLGQPAPKPPRRPIAVKNMNLIRAPKRGKGAFTEIARWNATARQGAWNETMKRPHDQNRGIRRASRRFQSFKRDKVLPEINMLPHADESLPESSKTDSVRHDG